MSSCFRVRRGLFAILALLLLTASATGCGVVQCTDPEPERVPELLAEGNIVLPADAELVGVAQGCWQDDSVSFSVALPRGSADNLLQASSLDSPLEPLTYPQSVADGSTVEPGPGVFEALESSADPFPIRNIVVDYSDPDRAMIHITY